MALGNMTADADVYRSSRLARRYAFNRPDVHSAIWSRVRPSLACELPVAAALDIGCGAGLSTVALMRFARQAIGVDPAAEMIEEAQAMPTMATFLQGNAHALPFDDEVFELVTAAGSLNYTNVALALEEVSRVLHEGGYFVAFDFSAGRIVSDLDTPKSCFQLFMKTFPALSGYALDLNQISYQLFGLERVSCERFEVVLFMNMNEYVEYLLSETNVECAMTCGMTEHQARVTCQEIFSPLFADDVCPVRFESEYVCVQKRSAHLNKHAE